MRRKRFDLCQVFQCLHSTMSGERERDVAKRYCQYHMPENLEITRSELMKGQFLHSKSPKKIFRDAPSCWMATRRIHVERPVVEIVERSRLTCKLQLKCEYRHEGERIWKRRRPCRTFFPKPKTSMQAAMLLLSHMTGQAPEPVAL